MANTVKLDATDSRSGITTPTLQKERLMLMHVLIIGLAFLFLFIASFFLSYSSLKLVAGIGLGVVGISLALSRYNMPMTGYLLAMIFIALLIATSPFYFGKLDSIPFGVLVLIFLTSYVLGDRPFFWIIFALFLASAGSYYLFDAIHDFPPGPYGNMLDGFHFAFAVLLFFLTLRLYFKEYNSYKKALSANQLFLDKIIDLNPNPIFVRNNNGQFLKVNKAFLETFKVVSAKDLFGKTIHELPFDDQMKLVIDDLDRQIMEEKQTVAKSEVLPVSTQSNFNWFSFSLAPLRDTKGQLEATSGIALDLTDQKKAEQSQRSEKAMLRAILDGATDNIIAFDQHKKIIAYNKAAFESNKLFLGFELKVKGEFFSMADHDWVASLEEAVEKTLATGKSQVQYPFTVYKGQNYFFASTTSPIIDKHGTIVGGTLISKNITAIHQAQLALEASEQRFRRFFEDAPMAILIRDPNKETYADANSRAIQLFGYTKKELLEIKRSDLSHKEDTQTIYRDISRLQSGEILTSQNNKVFKRKDGSIFWARVNRSLLKIEGKDYLIGFVENIEDQIQTQQALKESEARLRRIVTNAFSLFIVNDTEGKALFVSPNIEKALGYTQQEFLSINYQKLCHPDDLQQLLDSIDAIYPKLVAGESYDFELRVKKKEGAWSWFEVKLILFDPSKEGPFGGQLLTIARNIDTEKKARLLVQKNMGELNLKNQELQKYIESNMQLENFAYIASHDLRAPVRTIISFAQLLERSAKSKLSEKEQDFLHFITSATSNMNVLIDDLLAFSRVNTDEKRIQSIALPKLFQEILDSLHATIFQQKAIIRLHHIPQKIEADPTKLRQLLQNLISNAIKFSRPEEQPQVDINVEESESMWTFTIRDNGIGIPPEFQEKIFLLFKKLHPSDQYEGTGIGLALCKKIVEQHGGRIWVASNQNQGATFTFTIAKQQ